MASSKLICPECESVLRPARPVPDGKRVTCPKCKTLFTTPGLVEDERPSRKAKAGAKKGGGKKPAEEPAVPKPAEDDEGGGGIYSYVQEDEPDEEQEEAHNITYAPDMSIKDLRGPAQAKIMRPSNALIFVGALGAISCLVLMIICLWPFVFKDYLIDHEDFLETYYKSSSDKKEQEKSKNIPKERKDLSKEQLAIIDNATEALAVGLIIVASACFASIIFYAFQIFGAVKMQNMESYRWSMAAAILGIISFFPVGLWALLTLKDQKVIDGFNYKPE